MTKLNVYTKEGTGSWEHPNYLVPAKVYLNDEYVGETGTGGGFKGGGLNGIQIPDGVEWIKVKVVSKGRSLVALRAISPTFRLMTLIFNLTTEEIRTYVRRHKK